MSEGGKKGRRDRRPEGGLLEDPLFLEAERKKKEGRK